MIAISMGLSDLMHENSIKAGMTSGRKRGLVMLSIFAVWMLIIMTWGSSRDRDAPRIWMVPYSNGTMTYELMDPQTRKTIRPATKKEYDWQQRKHLVLGGGMVVLLLGVGFFPRRKSKLPKVE